MFVSATIVPPYKRAYGRRMRPVWVTLLFRASSEVRLQQIETFERRAERLHRSRSEPLCDALRRLGEDVAEDADDLVHLGRIRDERRCDLDDRIATVVLP